MLTWKGAEGHEEQLAEVVRVGAEHFVARTAEGAELVREHEGGGWYLPAPGGDAELRAPLPVCKKCGQKFAAPRGGEVCAVCLAKREGKAVCAGCGRVRVLGKDGKCRKCRTAATDAVVESQAAVGMLEALTVTHGKNGVPELPAIPEQPEGPPEAPPPFLAGDRVAWGDDETVFSGEVLSVHMDSPEALVRMDGSGFQAAVPLCDLRKAEAVCAGCAESGPASGLTGGLCKACAPSFPPPVVPELRGDAPFGADSSGFIPDSVEPARVCKGSYGTGPEDDCGAILGSDVEGDYCARCLRFQSARTDVLRAPPNRVARVGDVLADAFEAAWVALSESPALDPTTVAACKRLHDMICREARS